MTLDDPSFWLAVMQIIAIDILLGGDNAVVIALACRDLPPEQRRKGILWGVAGAVGLRVAATGFAVVLLAVPYLKMIGGLLLLWIGGKLIIQDESDEQPGKIAGSTTLLGAVRTVIIADFVMSLDNIIAVAAAAKDNIYLIVFGLIVSIPIIVWCSQFILKLMGRYPVIVTLGGALLGFIAGDMIVRDPVLSTWVQAHVGWLQSWHVAGALGAILVVVVAKLLSRRHAASIVS